jgi:competence protein ComEC
MKARPLIALILLCLCSCEQNPQVNRPPTSGLETTFFDVGQGDAALLKTPEATVVIDTGHNGDTVRLLRQEGVTHIDLLILSHPHADHTGGLGAIVRYFPVAELWYAGQFRGRIHRVLDTTPMAEAVVAGKKKMIGRLSLIVLHPEANRIATRTDDTEVNNGSIVVKAVYGESRFLFPGDCELGCWEELFKLHRSELRADVLKAAHHGSWNGTNSGVLGNVRPATIVISCGRGNEYGHPHQIVLRMIEEFGAKLLRTDEQGTIHCMGTICRSGSGA